MGGKRKKKEKRGMDREDEVMQRVNEATTGVKRKEG